MERRRRLGQGRPDRLHGRYLTGTSTYFGTEGHERPSTASSPPTPPGPASWNQIYGSNMNDSGMYVGACLQVCDVTIDHAWMENNALGYSGTNSGGAVVIENSQFDNNQDGVDTNTQIAGDPPPPQNGACPNGGTSPITHTHSCWVFMHNNVHDNNNGDTPAGRHRGGGPDRHRHDALGRAQRHRDGQHLRQQRRLGHAVRPLPRLGHPVAAPEVRQLRRLPDQRARAASSRRRTTRLLGNTYTNDGFFGNPTNADFGQILLHTGLPSNCYADNTAPKGSTPANLEQLQPKCGVTTTSTNTDNTAVAQVECDTRLAPCPAGANYPAQTGVRLEPLPQGAADHGQPVRRRAVERVV